MIYQPGDVVTIPRELLEAARELAILCQENDMFIPRPLSDIRGDIERALDKAGK